MSQNNNYFTHLILIRLQGFWRLNNRPKSLAIILEHILFTVNLVCVVLCLLASLLHMIFKSEDMSGIVLDFALVFMNYMGISHLTYMKMHRENMEKLIEMINDKQEYSIRTGLDDFDMKGALKVIKLWGYLWTPVGFLAVQLAQIDAIYHKKLSSPTYFPLIDTYASPYFQILSIVYYIGAAQMGLSFTNIDSIMMPVLLLTAQQFRMLSEKFKAIHFTALINLGLANADRARLYRDNFLLSNPRMFPESEPNTIDSLFQKTLTDIQQQNFQAELCKLMRECVEHRQTLLDICREGNRLLSPILFVRAVYATLCISVCPFYAYAYKDTNLVVAQAMAQYAILNIFEFGSMCYMGSRLTDASNEVHQAVYNSPWYVVNSKLFDDVMRIIIMRSNEPVVISAGKFFNLSIQTMSNILQKSFSYFTFMQNMQAEK